MSASGGIWTVIERLSGTSAGIISSICRVPLPPGMPLAHLVFCPTRGELNQSANAAARRYVSRGASLSRCLDFAIAAAVGEACERYSAGSFSLDELLFGTGYDLGERCVSAELYNAFDEGADCPPYRNYDPGLPRHWVAADRLSDGKPIFVPAQLVYFGLEQSVPDEGLYWSTSSGLAAGADASAADTSALLELIERDAFLVHWIGGKSPRRIETESLDLPRDSVLRQLAEHRWLTVTLLDITTDLGVPVVLAAVGPKADGRLAFGASCRFSVHEAAMKAAEEALHSWMHVVRSTAQNCPPVHEEAVRTFLDHCWYYGTWNREKSLRFLFENRHPVSAQAVNDRWKQVTRGMHSTEPRAVVAEVLRKAGYEAYVADVTSPDIRDVGLHVSRALVPGLLRLFNGPTPQRLNLSRIAKLRRDFWFEQDRSEYNLAIHPFP